ncbi:MAG: IMP dehydrogenase [spirochete symbiont of Stewartia floridana]|nr:MAG: IMP dehydrogenase [spirochete symbiont of Stewartia floridana]
MTIQESMSYDDVLLMPGYSEVLPGNADVSTWIAPGLKLSIPVLSAAMDTVTEEDMAIAMALHGGAGVIHRNLSPEQQARHVSRTKRFLNWVIDDPVTIQTGIVLSDVRKIMDETGVTGLPVLSQNKLVGIITKRDLKFNSRPNDLVDDVMTKNLILETGTPSEERAREKFDKHRIEKLPVVDREGILTGLITVRDMEKKRDYPNAALDKTGSLIAGAAVSPSDWKTRLPLLLAAKVDFAVMDTAHGSSAEVLTAIAEIKKTWPNLPLIGGNIADGDGAQRLIDAGADVVKVGVGPGSICTTRVVTGIGVPQFSAVANAVEVCDRHDIPVIADGGIKYSGDIVKAIGAGASAVMIGNLLAGLKESPGKEIIYEGRIFKTYRGMGSISAIQSGGGDRYRMAEDEAPVPEGIEGRVPYRGELKPYLHQLITGLKKGMGYTGCATLDSLMKYRRFIKITPAGLHESHPHDVSITQEAPNYTRS